MERKIASRIREIFNEKLDHILHTKGRSLIYETIYSVYSPNQTPFSTEVTQSYISHYSIFVIAEDNKEFLEFCIAQAKGLIRIDWPGLRQEITNGSGNFRLVPTKNGGFFPNGSLGHRLSIAVSQLDLTSFSNFSFWPLGASALQPGTNSSLVRFLRTAAIEALGDALAVARSESDALRNLDLEFADSSDVENPIEQITEDPSFQDKRGALPFEVSLNQIALIPSGFDDKKIAPRTSLLSIEIEELDTNNVAQRLSNYNYEISSRIEKYKEIFEKKGANHEIHLWRLGNDIQKYLDFESRSNENLESNIPEDIRIRLSSFLLAHTVYVSSFDSIESIIEDIERSAVLYSKFSDSEQILPLRVGKQLQKHSDVLNDETLQVAESVFSEANVQLEGTQGKLALAISFLRGAFFEMSTITLNFLRRNSDVSASTSAIESAHMPNQGGKLITDVVSFIDQNSSSLILLAEQYPSKFGWLKILTQISEAAAKHIL